MYVYTHIREHDQSRQLLKVHVCVCVSVVRDVSTEQNTLSGLDLKRRVLDTCGSELSNTTLCT